ncbi:MAG TPA: hypothetical protein VG839_05905 [Asticcacaulis sp.]|nr:hypothetical protein [Asticcacaulis sp.]
MKLKDDLGVAARVLYFIFGVVLGAAGLASAWSDYHLVTAGKASPVGIVLVCLVILPLSLFVILWACIGRHREWRIDGSGIRIRLLSLTSWQKDVQIQPADIAAVEREQYNYDDTGGRVAYGVTITLKDGKTYRSPRSFNATEAEAAWTEIERFAPKSQAGQ